MQSCANVLSDWPWSRIMTDHDDKPQFPDNFNMASYFLDANLAAGRGSKVALRWADCKGGEGEPRRVAGQWTYAQTALMTNRIGDGLKRLGMQPEQRFLTVLFDGSEFAATWFGGIRAGFVATQVNPLLPAEDYLYYLNYTKAPVAVIDALCLPAFEQILDGAKYLRHLVVAHGTAGRHVPYLQLMADSSPEWEAAPTHKDDPAVWLFTSGSTGKPKAAVHAHFHFPYNTECYAKRVVGYDETFSTISVPKLYFGYATGTNLMFPFAVGGTACLFADRATPDRLCELVRTMKPTFLTTVPTMMSKMLASGRDLRADLASLKLGVTAGEALPQALYDQWIAATGVELLDGIGSAESFHIYISNYRGDVRPGCLGKIVPGYSAKVCDDDGKEVAANEIGTLHVTGDSAALMYWSDYAKSIAVLRGGTIVSGDKFRRDDDGYYFYVGRADDLLKVGGVYVSPLEIENCMLGHPSVSEVCVVGIQDENGLTLTKALVVPAPGVKPDDALAQELQEFVKQRLVRYKYPRIVEFRTDLPKNDRGKIDRKALKV
jgi:benzoate-CoA ligase